MNKKFSACILLAMFFVITAFSLCYAQEWELIEEKKVPKDWVSASIEIVDQNAMYKELKFGVQNAAMKAKKIIATAVDGSVHEYVIETPSWIEPGETTSPILLSKDGLALKTIKLEFFARKSVIVQFYGKNTAITIDE